MKKAIKLTTLLILLAISFSVKAQDLNVIHTIPSPAGLSLDLAYDGEALWVGSGYQDSLLYRISTVDGAVLKTLVKAPQVSPAGLTFAEGYLYITDTDPSLIHKVDTTDGTFVQTYPAPFDSNGYPSGLTWDGTYFWLIDAVSGNLYQLDINFQVVQTITGQIGAFGSGLAFINGKLWFTENLTDKLYEMDTTDFEILQEFEITQDIYPNGSVDDKDALININVFPNPVDETLYFDLQNFDTHSELEVSIYDIKGRQIRIQELNRATNSIDVIDLTSGNYVFVLRSKMEVISVGQFIVH